MVLAYVLITIQSGSENEVLEKISSFKETLEVDMVYGEYDAIVKVQVDEMPNLEKFLSEKLRALPNIFLTTTMIVAKQFREK
ncbi:Lrp/AsnC family transcriptional regulator [Candidatus Bathyarchaeota archaeon]|nr:Lrp/AsnC family transcriptional regulator [Candidatus Bathyarchaeota archaeon]